MFYVIEGRRYEAVHPKTFDLNVLRDIKAATGLKPSDLQVLTGQLKQRRTLVEILDDEAALLAFSVIIWASRRAAGEVLTMEEACAFDLSTFAVEASDEEREALEAEMRRQPSDHESPDPQRARSRQKSPGGKRIGRKAPSKRTTSGPSTT